jgi:UDP-glucose 4-epimerase
VSGSAERSRRVLVTGADTFWGGRLARALEADAGVEVVVGIGTRPPSVPLERTEYVRVADHSFSTLNRIVGAIGADTIVHTGLVVDSTIRSSSSLHELNVIGTMQLLAAAAAPGSTVKSLVVKSSGLVYGASSRDPYSFDEHATRSSPSATPLERSLLDAEALVFDFGRDNPDVTVCVLRFANVLGSDLRAPLSRNLARPLSPALFGYDPMLQFVEQEDVVRALLHALDSRLSGTFNVAGAGRLPLSEVAAICGTRLVPLFPWQTRLLTAPLWRARLFDLPPELVALLRYGRGMDTTAFEATGFTCRHSSLGAVHAFARDLRLRKAVGSPNAEYRYEEDLERFLRHANALSAGPGSTAPD